MTCIESNKDEDEQAFWDPLQKYYELQRTIGPSGYALQFREFTVKPEGL
jgi:hypothetical protein